MKAQEARKLSLSVTTEAAEAQLVEVSGKIKAACDKGELACVYFGNLLPAVVKKFTTDGFKLEQKEDNERGMTSVYYQISW